MAFALLIVWRDGKQEYLCNDATRHVEVFATRAAAIARRRAVREHVEWELGAIDVVPYQPRANRREGG
jgi:hypothetical protein